MEGTIGPAGASDEPYQAPTFHPVIEVTNLVIPAGTLWRTPAYHLTSVTLDEAAVIQWAFYLQTAAPLPAGHQLRLDLGDNPNSHDSLDLITCSFLSAGDTVVLEKGSDGIQNLRQNIGLPAEIFTGDLHLVAEGNGNDVPTSAPITIIRARAAFVVI